jgi:hypothetical protein
VPKPPKGIGVVCGQCKTKSRFLTDVHAAMRAAASQPFAAVSRSTIEHFDRQIDLDEHSLRVTLEYAAPLSWKPSVDNGVDALFRYLTQSECPLGVEKIVRSPDLLPALALLGVKPVLPLCAYLTGNVQFVKVVAHDEPYDAVPSLAVVSFVEAGVDEEVGAVADPKNPAENALVIGRASAMCNAKGRVSASCAIAASVAGMLAYVYGLEPRNAARMDKSDRVRDLAARRAALLHSLDATSAAAAAEPSRVAVPAAAAKVPGPAAAIAPVLPPLDIARQIEAHKAALAELVTLAQKCLASLP